MTVLLIVIAWLLLATALGLVIGRAIRLADDHEYRHLND